MHILIGAVLCLALAFPWLCGGLFVPVVLSIPGAVVGLIFVNDAPTPDSFNARLLAVAIVFGVLWAPRAIRSAIA